jgi:hypothetical protein
MIPGGGQQWSRILPFKFLFCLSLVSSLLAFTGAGNAQSVSASGTIEIAPLTVKGFTFDEAYSKKHKVAVPAPFTFIAPPSKYHLNYLHNAPGGTGIFKISFTTPTKQVMSNLQFVPLKAGMGPIDKRLDALVKLVLKKAFAGSVPDPKQAKIDTVRKVKIGAYPAVEAIGRYKDGADGTVVLRIVAIPNPKSEQGMLAVINGLPKNVAIKKVGDILNTRASKALSTFYFK